MVDIKNVHTSMKFQHFCEVKIEILMAVMLYSLNGKQTNMLEEIKFKKLWSNPAAYVWTTLSKNINLRLKYIWIQF